jgi:hypothetical protein
MDMPPMDEPPMGGDMGGFPEDEPVGDEDFSGMDDGGTEDFDEKENNNNILDLSEFSLEDAAAIKKYADSFKEDDDKEDNGDEENQDNMPMESKSLRDDVISEIMNSFIDNERSSDRTTKRDERFVPKNKMKRTNPFVSNR